MGGGELRTYGTVCTRVRTMHVSQKQVGGRPTLSMAPDEGRLPLPTRANGDSRSACIGKPTFIKLAVDLLQALQVAYNYREISHARILDVVHVALKEKRADAKLES